MKKRMLALISLIMSIMMGIACLSGCNLVTSDMERDMNQTVATVNVEYSENILKKDLVLQYLNGGYLYTQYYSYTTEQTFELLLNGLIQNRIFVQYVMKDFEEDTSIVKDTTKAVNTPERYLSAEQLTDALYNTRKSINNMLESYATANDEEEVQDTIIGDVRTAPTNASNKEKELTKAEKDTYNSEAFDIKSSNKRRSAFDKLIKLFKDNGLLGSAYNGKIEETEYYKTTLKVNYESQLLEAYEEKLTKAVRQSITFEMLEQTYEDKYNEQKAWSNSEFVDGLNNATAESPLLYSAFGKYGYVYNLLLGVSDDQKEQIENIRIDNPNISDSDYATERKNILDNTTAQDLRSSWILSNYKGDVVGGEFVFDTESGYSFATNGLPFGGTVRKIKDATADEDAKYTVESVETLNLTDFLVNMKMYLGVTPESNSAYTSLGDSIYEAANLTNVVEYDEKIQDLLFAYSTDSGSLNTYKGYDIAPAVDGSDSEEYVSTFGEAGRILLEQGQGYVIVASDYGYHIMFFSEIINSGYGYANLVSYLNAITGESKDQAAWKVFYQTQLDDYEAFSLTDSYLYKLANSVIETKVSNAISESQMQVINKYRYEETNHVTIYSDRYADLLG